MDAEGLGLDQPTGAEKAKPELGTSQRIEALVNMQICPDKGFQSGESGPYRGWATAFNSSILGWTIDGFFFYSNHL